MHRFFHSISLFFHIFFTLLFIASCTILYSLFSLHYYLKKHKHFFHVLNSFSSIFFFFSSTCMRIHSLVVSTIILFMCKNIQNKINSRRSKNSKKTGKKTFQFPLLFLWLCIFYVIINSVLIKNRKQINVWAGRVRQYATQYIRFNTLTVKYTHAIVKTKTHFSLNKRRSKKKNGE